MTASPAVFSHEFEEQYMDMSAEQRNRIRSILRSLNCLRMALVSCEVDFGDMDIMIPLDGTVGLLIIITDNPVRATIQFELLDA